MDKKQLAKETHRLLVKEYGLPEWRPHLSPVAELVSTILSQNTNDQNRDLAFERLRGRFSSWEEVRDAEEKAVIEAIRPAGLANQKGPRIQKALEIITAERGELELDFLREKSPQEAADWLTAIKGVGPKTAAIVLLFSLDMPAFPVDTHVHRVTRRIGIIPQHMNAEKAHDSLAGLFEPDMYFSAHLNIIRLGREICQARKPNCPQCPLKSTCRYYEQEFSPDA